MRIVRAALAAALLSGVAVVAAPSSPAVGADSVAITDPQLLVAIEEATAQRTDALTPRVAVEVLTTDATGVAAAVRGLGGSVVGQVGLGLVQADVPVTSLEALAGTDGATFVRAARQAGRPPNNDDARPPQVEAGTGAESTPIDHIRARAWHDAGFTGAGVKVGIVDYFDMTTWNATENGPKPTLANGHVFCRDTAGFELCSGADILSYTGYDQGISVVESLKDIAPGAEVFLATVGTLADLQAAIDWFVSKGVTIINRSLDSAYDGPGDGTGPSADVVTYAAIRGLTWFNSAGDNGQDQYLKFTVPTTLSATGYVDFDNGPNVDTWLRLDGSYLWFDGIRWSDWYNSSRTDYSIEFWAPKAGTGNALYYAATNPTSSQVLPLASFNTSQYYYGESKVDNSQAGGAAPLEANDLFVGTPNYYGTDADGNGQGDGMIYMRMRKNAATPVGAAPDTLEIALAHGAIVERSTVAGSAAKAVVDSKLGALVAVGAAYVHEAGEPGELTQHTSHGPTTDGRVKPDVFAPSWYQSVTWGGVFDRSRSASPVAAGVGALLQGAGLAASGEGTGAMVRHFVIRVYGSKASSPNGFTLLPPPPTAATVPTAGRYVPLALPVRGLDTRPYPAHLGPDSLMGPYAPQAIVDFNVLEMAAVPDTGVSAVAINLTSVAPVRTGYLQAFPYMRAKVASTSTVNIATAGANRPNFAIVPIGQDGTISVYVQTGGNIIIDVLGYYLDGQPATVADGRFIPLAEPERWVDTRGFGDAPLPATFEGTPRLAEAGETIEVPTPEALDTAIPAGEVAALVVNVTAAGPQAGGFLQLLPTGAVGATHSNVNYTFGTSSANTAIVPLGAGGSLSVLTSQRTNIIVDIVGYITNDAAPDDSLGMFVPITPGRAIDTRLPTVNPFAAGESRTFTLTQLVAPTPLVPAGAAGVSANLTVVNPPASGYLSAYPGVQPSTSNLNFSAGKTVANGALLALSATGTVNVTMSQPGNVIIDINGYFLAGQLP